MIHDEMVMWGELTHAWLKSIGAKDLDFDNGLKFSWRDRKFRIGLRLDPPRLCFGEGWEYAHDPMEMGLVDPLNPDFNPAQFFEPFRQEMEKIIS